MVEGGERSWGEGDAEGGPWEPSPLAALWGALPDGLLLCDEAGRIVDVNRAFEELSGRARSELVGRPVGRLLPGVMGPAGADGASSAPRAQGRPTDGDAPDRLLRNDGTEAPVDVVLAPCDIGARRGTLVVVRCAAARVRSERRLRESEARYRLLVERSPAITHISRPDATSSTIYISPQAGRILGYPPHEWETDPELWPRILHPEDRERALAANERLIRDGEPFVLDYRVIARDGRVVWIHEESDVVRDEDGRPRYVQGVMFDVTEAKQAETLQQAHLRQLAALAELSRMAVVGRPLEEVLQRAAELASEILGIPLVGVFEPDEEARVLRLRAGVGWREGLIGRMEIPLGTGAPVSLAAATEEPYVFRDLGSEVGFEGSSLLVEHGASICVPIRGRRLLGVLGAHATAGRGFPPWVVELLQSVAGVLAQAIERDEADRLLRDRERLLAEAEAIAHLGSWEWDPERDRSVWSEEVYRIFGLDPEGGPLSYEAYLGMVHEEDRRRVDQAIRCVLQDGGSYVVDYRIRRRRDGVERIVREQGRVDAPAAGRTRRVVGTVLDVTDLRRAEQELARSLERLRRADAERRRLLGHLIRAREEERAQVAADIHDDPLQKVAALKLRVGLLRELATSPRQIEQIDVVEGTIGQVISSLRNLLFQLRPLTLDRDGLAATLRELLHRVGEEAGFSSTLRDEMETEPPPESRVTCYRIAQEALANIRKHARASFAEVHLRTEGGGTRVRIQDDGRGFDPERLSPRPGHLGLPDMRERAELAGGWLRVTSAPGAGTVVEFWIPSWGA